MGHPGLNLANALVDLFEAGCRDERERERERERDRLTLVWSFHWYQAVLLLLDFNDGSLVDHVKSSCVIAFPIIYPYRVVGERYTIGTWQNH